MIQKKITGERRQQISASLLKISILAKLIQLEHAAELTIKFNKPEINRFASRIGSDATAIQNHLAAGEKVSIRYDSLENVDEFTTELYRAFEYFMCLDTEQIREFMDGVRQLQESQTA